MKDFRNTDYAANKKNVGIVYRFADGEVVVVTLEDFLEQHPDKTAEDFDALKTESDSIYKEEDREIARQGKKTTVLEALDKSSLREDSPEDLLVQAEERTYQRHIATASLSAMTAVQRRRYILHFIKGLTVREIALMEGTSHPSVVESLLAAQKKIKKLLKNS